MLEAAAITVRIGAATLLRRVSFSVSPGEVVAIIGPNGAGKSTLLKALSGSLPVASGKVVLGDREIQDWARIDLARARAVLSQKIELALPFTALEVVLLGRAPHRKTARREDDVGVALMAMRESDTAGFADRTYTSLSGGEQQRVHLARVLTQIWRRRSPPPDERYLLLDEPTASLDLAHQHATLAVARRLAGDGAGVVAVLHDLNLAAMYADRLCLLKDGAVAAAGGAEAVLRESILERVFALPLAVTRHPTRDCLQVSAA